MSYEVRKVANGFVVIHKAATYVFRTWAQASAWIRRQFEPLQ